MPVCYPPANENLAVLHISSRRWAAASVLSCRDGKRTNMTMEKSLSPAARCLSAVRNVSVFRFGGGSEHLAPQQRYQ